MFDSGSGGLTVVRQIRRLLPSAGIIYLADTANLPYGEKSAETIKRLAVNNVRFLLSHGAGVIVVACNTSSSQAMSEMEEVSTVPVLSVVRAGARLAVSDRAPRKIALVATQGTIRSGAYQREIRRLAPQCTVEGVACPQLVPLIESNAGDEEIEPWVRYYLSQISPGYERLLLGCTHYPLIADLFKRNLPSDIPVIDPAEELAQELAALPACWEEGDVDFYATGEMQVLKQKARETLGLKKVSVKRAVTE